MNHSQRGKAPDTPYISDINTYIRDGFFEIKVGQARSEVDLGEASSQETSHQEEEMNEVQGNAQGWHNHENALFEQNPLNPNDYPPPPPQEPYPQIPPPPLEPPPPISPPPHEPYPYDPPQNPPYQNRPLCEQVIQRKNQVHNPIRLPHIDAKNFSIKSHMFSLVESRAQFHGKTHDDPHSHLYNFEEICNTGFQNSACQEFTRLALFPFSLKGQAKEWLMSLPHHHLQSWDDIKTEFLKQYFPPGRYLELKVRVTTFKQNLIESLDNAWDRFKKLLRACPNHDYTLEMQVQLFYRVLHKFSRKKIDLACHGSLMMSTAQDVYKAIERVTRNENLWDPGPSDLEVSIGDEHNSNEKAILRDMAVLNKKMDELQAGKRELKRRKCDDVTFGVFHIEELSNSDVSTQEEMSLLRQRRDLNNTHTNVFEPHPFYQQVPTQQAYVQQSSQSTENVSHLKILMENLMGVVSTQAANMQTMMTSIGMMSQEVGILKTSISGHEIRMRTMEASIRFIEDLLTRKGERNNSRPPGGLPSNTERNPREVHVITRCGKSYGHNEGSNEVEEDLNDKKEEEWSEEEEEIIDDFLKNDGYVEVEEEEEQIKVPRLLKNPRLSDLRTLFNEHVGKESSLEGPVQTEPHPAQPKLTSVQPDRATQHPERILKKKV